MKKVLINIWWSMPIQLLLLHLKRYQLILVFWYLLFATLAGSFMKMYGADALFLAPEYFNKVSAVSTGIVGFSFGIFIMSWNITTFILHGHLISFLATTKRPFLKYCINNAILPICFLVYYFISAVGFISEHEMYNLVEIVFLSLGFTSGFIISIFIGFVYFFGADKTIYSNIGNAIKSANFRYKETIEKIDSQSLSNELKIKVFLNENFKISIPRDVRHYDEVFLKSILKKHHTSAVIAILVSFVFLIILGYLGDEELFQIPAAASIVLFFSILIAVVGAFTIFFKNWNLVFFLIIYFFVNLLYQNEIIDPRNKAYGLNYDDKKTRPIYSREEIEKLSSQKNIDLDKANYLKILNNWKAKQKDSLPILYIINTSGGGLRSANFTMDILQELDAMMNCDLMNKTLFITGASGGMLGATYYRELFLKKLKGEKINLLSKEYVDNISKDLLNPLFSSFVSRDIVGPVQKFNYQNFTYTKDRGHAFEQKLNDNTRFILNKQLKEYTKLEHDATIPLMFFNTVISRDARKMIIASNPARFLMKPMFNKKNINATNADAIDFNSYFVKQNSTDLNLLSALRMNATFPYVLPNVWLPSNPIIDVMDAGLRDNYGPELTLRFLSVFADWIKKNTSKVIILQIRDRSLSDWDKPKENDDYISFLTKPFSQLQHNWFNLQDYYQAGQLKYCSEIFGDKLQTICWQYLPTKQKAAAGLSFHLTSAEKIDIAASVTNTENKEAFNKLKLEIIK